MSEPKHTHVSQFEPTHGSVRSYTQAFVTCIALTIAAYAVAVNDSIDNTMAIAIIALLALVQLVVQLRKFLHLGEEFKPRWKLWVFTLMLVIVVIIVGGSVWIMQSLDYRMQHKPAQVQEYLDRQSGF